MDSCQKLEFGGGLGGLERRLGGHELAGEVVLEVSGVLDGASESIEAQRAGRTARPPMG